MKKAIVFVVLLFLATISACNNQNEISHDWKESKIFESGNYKMIGTEGRVGFIYDKENLPLVEGQANKFMWHFWGDKEQLEKKLKVVGTHRESNEEVMIIPETSSVLRISPHNGADVSLPSNMEFKKSGMWKLDVYLGNKLFDSIYVNVNNK